MSDFEDDFLRAVGDRPVELSAEGLARRIAMRNALEGSVVNRRRRRTATRWGAVVGAVACVAALLLPRHGPLEPEPRVRDAAFRQFEFDTVATDTAVMARYSVERQRPAADVWVDDEQLLALLGGAQRPTGLIRTDSGVRLTRPVIDDFGE